MRFHFVGWKSNTLRSNELLVAPNATVIAVTIRTRGCFVFMLGFLSLFNVEIETGLAAAVRAVE